jgi:hypothetical protein
MTIITIAVRDRTQGHIPIKYLLRDVFWDGCEMLTCLNVIASLNMGLGGLCDSKNLLPILPQSLFR